MVRLTPRLLAIVGPTATGKSALGIAMAQRFGGEIVSCDSTAVYRGFDIGTDKVPPSEQRGIPHHMVDVVDPVEEYSAARYAREAAAVIRDITSRGRLPILVGGTGLYYRALTRGMFEGPGRDEPLRRRLERIAARRGPSCLHRWLGKVDPPSAERIQIPDVKRLVRALEVWIVTGRPLTGHFADDRVAAGRLRDHDRGAADSGGGHHRAGGEARRRAVRARTAGRDARRCWRAASRKPRCRSRASSTGRRSSTCTACATRRRLAS